MKIAWFSIESKVINTNPNIHPKWRNFLKKIGVVYKTICGTVIKVAQVKHISMDKKKNNQTLIQTKKQQTPMY